MFQKQSIIQVPFENCPSTTRKPKVTIDEKDKGKNVNWIRFELKMFVKQRTFARNFIDFLVNATVNLRYFNETEAIRVREIFYHVEYLWKLSSKSWKNLKKKIRKKNFFNSFFIPNCYRKNIFPFFSLKIKLEKISGFFWKIWN